MRERLRRLTATPVAAGVCAALVGLIAFWPALSQGWVYDDHLLIESNPLVIAPAGWRARLRAPFWPPHTSIDKLYRPLTVASFRLDTLVSGGTPDPRVFHAENLVLHGAVAAVVALIAGRSGGWPAAWTAGLLFAAHPVLTEAVVTAYGRSELLSALFGLIVLWRESRHDSAPPSLWSRLATGALFTAAVLAKEGALAVWPAAALLQIQRWRERPAGAREPWPYWVNRVLPALQVPYVVAAIVLAVLRWNALHGFRLETTVLRRWDDPLAGAGPVALFLTPPRLLWTTVRAWTDPRHLCPLWSPPALDAATTLTWDVAAGLAVAVALVSVAVASWRKGSRLAPLLTMLAPVLAVPLHVPHLAHWIFAERWLYLPTAVAALVVGVAAGRWGFIPALAVAAALVPVSRSYARGFADDLAMGRESVRRQPDGFHGQRTLALALQAAGRPAEARQVAREMDARFGRSAEAALVELNAAIALGSEPEALAALERFTHLVAGVPAEWIRAQQERARGRPSASPAP